MDQNKNGDRAASVNLPRMSDGFGKSLLRLLSEKGLNQRSLALAAKISPSNLSSICSGKRQVGLRIAGRIADALKLDDQERAAFLNLVRLPRWRGLENTPNLPEKILGDWLVRDLASNGIPTSQIESVVPLQQPNDSGADTYIILKNGEIIELELKIRRKRR